MAHGHPNPEINWITEDDRNIESIPDLREIYRNGTLKFLPFSSDMYRQDIHANVYRCSASNVFGRIVSSSVKVRAAMTQSYKGQVYDKYVIKGNTAVFQCRIPSYVSDDVIVTSWITEDNMKIDWTSSYDENSRYTMFKDGFFHIRNVQTTDDGLKFWCQMQHRLNGNVLTSSTSGTLHVKEPRGSMPPQVLHMQQEVRIQDGKNGQIPCVAEGYPPPDISWFFIDSRNDRYIVKPSKRFRLMIGALVILDSKREDSGLYECYISNSVGNQRVKTKLVVSARLDVSIIPKQQVVDVGQSAYLNCSVNGFPVEKIEWRKNGDLIERIQKVPLQIFMITSMSREDSGMYQCFVANDVNSAQATSQVLIGDVYPVIIETFREEISQPGPVINLKCVSTGTPFPIIKWYLDDRLINNSMHTRINMYTNHQGHTIGHLNITQVQTGDGGLYTCKAENKAGQGKHSARIDVYGLPRIRPMANLSVTAGYPFQVRCHVYGYPIDSFTWLKDGKVLKNTSDQKILANGIVKFSSAVDRLHSGKYTCAARNRHGQKATGHFWVNVVVKPVVAKIYVPEHVRVGMQVGLYCSVLEGNRPMTKTWLKDGKEISVKTDIVIMETSGSSVLEIKKVTRHHNGNYTCLVENEAGSSNYTAILQVEASPSWIIRPKHQTAAVNQNLLIDCQATAHPAPSLSWKRKLNNQLVDIVDNDRVTVASNGSLVFDSVSMEDNGFYVCEVSNGIPPPLSEEISFTVGYPPRFKILAKNKRGKVGRRTTLQCEVFGNHPLSIKWLKNFKDLSTDSRYDIFTAPNVDGIGKMSNLKIHSIERSDGGRYNCEATNLFGTSISETSLLVEESPGKVDDLSIYGFENKSILISWKYPKFDGNSPVTNFIVEYSLLTDNTPSGHHVSRLNGSSRSYLLTHIKPSKHYVLQITAENSVGISKSNKRISFILSQNGSIILPSDDPTKPSFNLANYSVLLVLGSAVVFVLIFTAIFIIIYFIKKRKQARISRTGVNDRLDRQLYDKCKSKDAPVLHDAKENKCERYGRLLPPPTIEHDSCYSDAQTYKVKESSSPSNEGYYSEISPYATFHLAETLQLKDKPVSLRTFSPRNSAEMSSAL